MQRKMGLSCTTRCAVHGGERPKGEGVGNRSHRRTCQHKHDMLTYPFHTPVEQAPEGAQTRMHTPIACASAPGLGGYTAMRSAAAARWLGVGWGFGSAAPPTAPPKLGPSVAVTICEHAIIGQPEHSRWACAYCGACKAGAGGGSPSSPRPPRRRKGHPAMGMPGDDGGGPSPPDIRELAYVELHFAGLHGGRRKGGSGDVSAGTGLFYAGFEPSTALTSDGAPRRQHVNRLRRMRMVLRTCALPLIVCAQVVGLVSVVQSRAQSRPSPF